MAAVKLLLLAALAGYLLLAAIAWLAQDRLIFYPAPVLAPPRAPAGWRLEQVSLQAADGTKLAGVLVLPPVDRPPVVVYFGGNAEEVTANAATVDTAYGTRAALLVNYRGYGHSAGEPGEKALVADAVALLDWLRARTDVDPDRIALHGRSLGSGVAVQAAATRAPRCVVLTSPFTSALDIAKQAYPWLPVALLLRHPFDSAAAAPGLRMPALFVFGEEDALVPAALSRRLAERWGSPPELVPIPGAGHNDLSLDRRYDAAVRAFLDRCL